tara:strand:- start:77 stop:331 length:255 start_codon:yes stop_codon:yes gene_type:complete
MRITKEQLIEIIKEELENTEQSDKTKVSMDVERVAKALPAIDTAKEYQKLIELVMQLGDNIPQKGLILTALRKMLPEKIKDLKQ